MKKIKKYLPLLIFIIFMIMSVVIPFKYYMIKKYNYILPDEYIEVFKNAKKLEIKKDEKAKQKLNLDNVKFNVDYKYHFKRAETNSKTIHNYYYDYVDDQIYDADLIVEKNSEFISSIKQDDLSSKVVLNKKNIHNNKEIFDAMKKDYKTKTKFFTKKDDVLYLYVVRALIKQTIKSNSQLYYITGDYDGYLMVNDTKLDLHIFNENDDFVFTFYNKDDKFFNLDFVKKFITNIDFIR
jgi:hypothetical protein